MIFEVLSEEEFKGFALKHNDISIYQHPNWGKLKSSVGWEYYYVGLKENNKIIGATLLLRKKILFNMYLFYSPRGYLIDSKNKSLLENFHKYVVNFVKKHHGFMLKIDPNVFYNILDLNGNVKKECGHDDLNNYLKCGFNHLGFTLNFETMQPRFLCRYKVLDSYDNTIKSFSKSTQKNIVKAYDMGVRVEKVLKSNVPLFYDILSSSEKENGIITRPMWYYEKMFELFSDEIVYFLTYLDTDLYLNYVNKRLDEIDALIDSVKDKMNKYKNVGNKLKNELQTYETQKRKMLDNKKEAEDLRKCGDRIYIGALMSVFIGREGITFTSGTLHKYKKFNIKYAYYDAHLKETLNRGLDYVNFYGISGDLKETSKYYNIFEIKKGYNPEIIELLGEFDYIVSKPKYMLYKLALKVYKLLKKSSN